MENYILITLLLRELANSMCIIYKNKTLDKQCLFSKKEYLCNLKYRQIIITKQFRKQGFTLIELVLVIILIGMVIAFYPNTTQSNPDVYLRWSVQNISQVIQRANYLAQAMNQTYMIQFNSSYMTVTNNSNNQAAWLGSDNIRYGTGIYTAVSSSKGIQFDAKGTPYSIYGFPVTQNIAITFINSVGTKAQVQINSVGQVNNQIGVP